jgi:hypothetical protein
LYPANYKSEPTIMNDTQQHSEVKAKTKTRPWAWWIIGIIGFFMVIGLFSSSNDSPTQLASNSQSITVPIQATPVSQAPTQPKTWHIAYSYAGTASAQTPPFAMKGSQWRITRSCTINDSTNTYGGTINGTIESASKGLPVAIFASGFRCSTSADPYYVYSEDPGQYYLGIYSANASYNVKVEDYY